MIVPGCSARKAGMRGVSQRLPKVGSEAMESDESERADAIARTIISSD